MGIHRGCAGLERRAGSPSDWLHIGLEGIVARFSSVSERLPVQHMGSEWLCPIIPEDLCRTGQLSFIPDCDLLRRGDSCSQCRSAFLQFAWNSGSGRTICSSYAKLEAIWKKWDLSLISSESHPPPPGSLVQGEILALPGSLCMLDNPGDGWDPGNRKPFLPRSAQICDQVMLFLGQFKRH